MFAVANVLEDADNLPLGRRPKLLPGYELWQEQSLVERVRALKVTVDKALTDHDDLWRAEAVTVVQEPALSEAHAKGLKITWRHHLEIGDRPIGVRDRMASDAEREATVSVQRRIGGQCHALDAWK